MIMAEEKKKRWRPSLTEYRALEKELADVKESYRLQLLAGERLAEEVNALKSSQRASGGDDALLLELNERLESQIEGTSSLVAECDAWRGRYRSLDGLYQELKRSYDALRCDVVSGKDYRKLKTDYRKLENEHKLLTKAHKALKGEYGELAINYSEACNENKRLVNRGFWSRLFNK